MSSEVAASVAAASTGGEPGRVALGFALGLVAAAAFGLGNALQKRRAIALPNLSGRPLAAARAFLTDLRWLVATGVVLLAWGLEFAALRFAPVSLVLPSGVVGIAVLALLAHVWFGERLLPREWAGVSLCSLGVVIAILSIDAGSESAATRLDVAALVVSVAALSVAGLVLALAARRARRFAEIGLAAASGLVYAATGTLTKALSVASLGDGDVARSAVLLAALVSLSLVALFLLQAAFQAGRAVVVATVSGVLGSFLPAALGLPVFGEPWPEGGLGGLRWVALAALLVGFAFLGRASPQTVRE